jgi:hypothetical protein
VFVSKLMGGEYVGLLPTEEDFYEVYYGPVLLGWFDVSGQSEPILRVIAHHEQTRPQTSYPNSMHRNP